MVKNNIDRFMQLGLNIAFYRKMKGITQMELAEKAGISRTHISFIEAPNMDTSLSIQTLFDIADALEVEPSKFFEFRS